MQRTGQTEQTGQVSHSPESIIDLAGAELVQSVFRTANALLASPADAEEVALDALVQLHKKLSELVASAEPGADALTAWLEGMPAWLDQIAVNKAKGRAPKRKRHSRALDELAQLHEHASERENHRRVNAMLVKELLTYLPGRHRFVFVLAAGLGHSHGRVAELLHLEPAAVTRTLAVVESKLGEFGAHAAVAKALHGSVHAATAEGEDSPLHDYMRVFGGPDQANEDRIRRRFESHLIEGTGHLDLSGDSFHAGQFSGSHFRLDTIVPGAKAVEPELEPESASASELDVVESSVALGRTRQPLAWVVAGIACVAVAVLAVSQYQMSKRVTELALTQRAISQAGTAAPDAEGPPMLEPGSFVELEHGSRAEPSKDATAQLLRSDSKGAEILLSAGSISLHVKQAKDVQWIVHAGRYDITAIGTRFRVTYTDAVPEVEVFQGKVRVTGGLLGADGVDVSSANHTLAEVMATRELPVAPERAEPPGVPTDADPAQPETYEDPLALDAMFGRAVALRSTDPVEAEALLRRIIEPGRTDWVSERAFDQLRTLVAPDQREALRLMYFERFNDGMFAEPFGALSCQALVDDEADACWVAFAEAFPDSLYGP